MTKAAGSQSLRRSLFYLLILASILLKLSFVAGMPAENCPPADNLTWYEHGNHLIFQPVDFKGKSILILFGGISKGDEIRFEKYMEILSRTGKRIDEIWLDSPGGNPSIAINIARTIRKHGKTTRIPSGYWCISACNFIFLGGPFRIIDQGGQYVIHMFRREGLWELNIEVLRRGNEESAKKIIKLAEQASALSAAEATAFVTSMGVSTKLLTEEMYHVDSETVKCMSRSKIREFNVMNFDDGGIGPVRRIK